MTFKSEKERWSIRNPDYKILSIISLKRSRMGVGTFSVNGQIIFYLGLWVIQFQSQ